MHDKTCSHVHDHVHGSSCFSSASLAYPGEERLQTCPPTSRLITRQTFLRGLAALAFLPILNVPEAVADAIATDQSRHMEASEIAPGVFVHHGLYEEQNPQNQGDMANASFVVGKDCVAVIDTSGSAICGRGLRKAIRNVTDKPIRYVINTHMHPDHVFGNSAFRQDEPIYVGHYKLPAALEARAQTYLATNRRLLGPKASEGLEIIPSTLPIRKKFELDLGGRTLILEPERTAHTDNDLTIRDSLTDTWFLGDLLFAVRMPTIDGSIVGWLALLHDFESRTAARVVPGHGPKVMHLPGALKPEQLYLQTVADDVRKMIKDGKTLGQAVKVAGLSQRNDWKLFDDANQRNVTAAYAELEWD
jgi:quinoprotein relay system zinc metallohydrolase 2